MYQAIMDRLQWAFDLAFGLIPRRLKNDAVKPLLVGHRGVFEHPQVLENTLEAFDIAVSRGGGIEFDLHLTKDRVVVVHHDLTLQRVHRLPQAIADLTLAQLRSLAPAVPTLTEVVERYGHRCPHYFLEPKVTIGEDIETLLFRVGECLEGAGLQGKATLLSTDPRLLDSARHQLPWLAKAIVFFLDNRAAMRYATQHGDTGLAGWYMSFPTSMRTFLEQRGLHVGVGQIDYPNTYRHYCNDGFRFQFSNRIDRLVAPLEALPTPDSERILVKT